MRTMPFIGNVHQFPLFYYLSIEYMIVLVTGASGFVGRAACAGLAASGHAVRAGVRRHGASTLGADEEVVLGDLARPDDRRTLLSGVEVVVHLAARVHVMRESATDPDAAFEVANVAATLALARQAAEVGVRRLVFLSSIKVNGEGAQAPYRESDPPAPWDAYAKSKWRAEQGLRELASETGLEVVVLRPPLVYGPGVGANFLRLLRAVERGWPLPFGRVDNRRSLLFLGNLVDAIRVCLTHPDAAGKTYLVSDGEDLSSAELIRRMARAMGKPARLLPLPPAFLRFSGRLVGKSAEMERLLGSLTLDEGLIRRELEWLPPYVLDQGLALTVADYLRAHMKEPASSR